MNSEAEAGANAETGNRPAACFHCGEPIPDGVDIRFPINGIQQAFCCHGCRAVAEFISNQGQCDFYRYRGDAKPGQQVLPNPQQWRQWDNDSTFARVCQPLTDHAGHETGAVYTASIGIDGLYCSACGWLIDRQLREVPGVLDVRLNTITRQLQVDFNRQQAPLSQLLAVIDQLGYQPVLSGVPTDKRPEQERKASMKRLMVAGLGMMQVMMFAVALYGADFHGMDDNARRFFGLISMLVATAVYFYAGSVFVKNALRDLKNRHLGMDVPVALSISIAYFFSVWHVLQGDTRAIYFDSMVMFVFFLLAGRHLEMGVRHKGMNAREALAAMVPVSVRRLAEKPGNNGETACDNLPLDEIRKGDVLLVRHGEVIPCDGEVIAGQGEVDESLLTGESTPVPKKPGDAVLAGAKLLHGELRVRSTALGNETFLGTLTELLEQAQMQRPKSLQLVDRLAGWFVAAVLLLAALTAGWYAFYDPVNMIPVVLAVLVATCPCALSLATPAAFTAASVRLVRHGVLINRLDALGELPKCRTWVFDKTGTLTEFAMRIQKWHPLSDISRERACAMVAALERNNHHPIATAFDACRSQALQADGIIVASGKGVEGRIDGQRWRAGQRDWALGLLPEARRLQVLAKAPPVIGTQVWLAGEQTAACVFQLGNRLRPDAAETIAALQREGIDCRIVSGDEPAIVEEVARQLGISDWHGNYRPEHKINLVRDLQAAGHKVVMVGDGINDAPVLGQANVSFSFNQGAQLARSAADLVLMGGCLSGVLRARQTARKTARVIRQNITWAIAYNLAITPLAVAGQLQPWMAAIGMSLSSLLVVLNARRILHARQDLKYP